MKKKCVTWWNPYWSHCPATKKKWAVLLNRKSVCAIAAVSVVLCTAIVISVKHLWPQIQLAQLWWLAVQIPALFGLFYVYAWVDRLFPARIVVRDDRLIFQRGETVAVIYGKDIKLMRLTVFTNQVIRLTIRYRSKNGLRTMKVGVPTKVDLKKLTDSFQCPKKIVDARDVFLPSHGKRTAA